MALTVNSTNTLQLLNILNRTANSQSNSLTRLSTGSRINKGSDDPAGLIALKSLESELTSTNAAISNNQRTDAMLNVADSSLKEIGSLLSEVQKLAQASANSAGLSADELAANQAQIDDAIASIDRIISNTTFNGKKLLDGSLGINVTGVDTSDITSLRVFSRNASQSEDTTVTVRIDGAAEQAQLTSVIGNSATEDTSITIQGKLGTAVIEINSGENLSSIASKINAATAQTGVVASQTSATAAIGLRSSEYGSSAFARVTVLSGGDLSGGGSISNANDTGVDADISVNGQAAAVDGLTVNFNAGGTSFAFDITSDFNQSAVGSTTSFTIKADGSGATFQLGTDPSTRTTLGIDGLYSQQLGSTNVGGFLSSLKSGGANSLLSDPAAAAQIAAEANAQVAKLQGRIGGFLKFQVNTSLNSLNAVKEGLESAKSTISDVDYASETAELNRQNVLLQSAISLLGLANQQSAQVLSLLR